MKLQHLLEATSKKVIIIFIDGGQIDLFVHNSARSAWDELVQDGPGEDADTIIITEFSGTFLGLELARAHPDEVVVNGDDDGVVFARRNGKVTIDKYNLQNPIGGIMDDEDDSPEAKAVRDKLAARRNK